MKLKSLFRVCFYFTAFFLCILCMVHLYEMYEEIKTKKKEAIEYLKQSICIDTALRVKIPHYEKCTEATYMAKTSMGVELINEIAIELSPKLQSLYYEFRIMLSWWGGIVTACATLFLGALLVLIILLILAYCLTNFFHVPMPTKATKLAKYLQMKLQKRRGNDVNSYIYSYPINKKLNTTYQRPKRITIK